MEDVFPRPPASGGLPASLDLRRDGEILFLRLNRPEKRNALDDATVRGLEACFAMDFTGIRVVVLHGAGESFCAGLDLIELQQRSAPEGLAHSLMWHRAFERIQFGAVPVVSVLHGAVVGGGLELAAATHIRVAERSAFFALPEGQRGVFLGGGGAMRLPRLIGAARVMDMMLTGRVYSAEEAQQAGIAQYLVEPGEGLAKATELARRIVANAPLANFAILHALPRIAEAAPEQGLLMEAMTAGLVQSDPEAKSRIMDFLEKRAGKVREG
jgi:enoyl-CoA hydratase/carnithine racemase